MRSYLLRVLSFVLLLLVLSSAMPLSAFASNATDPAPASSAFESSASDFWYEIEGGEVTVTGYKGSSPSLVIPSTIDGYPVTAIHSAAFYGNRTIESAVIGDGVRKIGDGAFWGCTNLLSVSIGSGIVSIPEYAFCDCTSLSSLTFSNGLAEIGESAFSGCTSLVSLRLPESLFAIRQSAYKNCTALSDVVIPTSVLIIEDDAFYKTPWLDSLSGDPVIVGGGVLMKMQNGFREDLVIPEGVVSVYSRSSFTYAYVKTVFLPSSMRYWTQLGVELEAESFAVDQANPYLTAPEGVLYTKDMRELLAYPSKKGGAYTIPQGVLTIGPGAFIGEVSAVTLCDGLLQIGEQAFFNSKITEILIPSSVLAIGACAFQYCSSLRSVVLPSALCEIEASVFEGCSALESVSIGREVTSIGICAFSGCSSLSQVEFRGTKSEWDRIEIGMLNSPLTSASLSCTAQDAHTHEFGDFVEYDEATHLGVCRCGESTTEGHIWESEFTVDLEASLGLPGSKSRHCELCDAKCDVTEIPALNGSERYDSLDYEIIDGEIEIKAYVGADPVLILPSEIEGLPVRRISDFAFGQNSVIESVVLPSSLRVIGEYAFWNCPNLISVRVEEGITSLPKSIFSNCTSLSEVDLPSGLLQIGEGAFYACSSLASLVLPSGLEEIGQDAFYACSSLTALSLPSSLKVIGSSAFDTTPWYEALSDEYVIVGRGILLKVNNKYSDDIVISEGVSSIYASMYTFKSSYVGSVTLPASLCSWNHSDMGLKATGFAVSSENPYLEAIDGVLYTKGGETLLAFPAYRTGSFTLPSGVKKIGDGAFQNSALSAISLGDQLLEIGELAFYFCREIRELQIPNSVTRVGKGAMSAMASLSAVTLPNGLTELEGQLFFNCSSLTKVTLGGLVTKINASVFYGCPSSLVVCFDGSREAWGAIEVSGVGNDALASATIVCKGEEEPAPTLPDNLGAFREAVEAITVGSVGEAAYEELSGALILYGKLSADEKAAAGEEIAKLEAAISAYNAAVETVSGELDRASEIAVGSVSGSVTLLAVLALFLKKKFFA